MDEKKIKLRDERDEKRRHVEHENEKQPLRGDESPNELISGPVVMESQPETD